MEVDLLYQFRLRKIYKLRLHIRHILPPWNPLPHMHWGQTKTQEYDLAEHLSTAHLASKEVVDVTPGWFSRFASNTTEN